MDCYGARTSPTVVSQPATMELARVCAALAKVDGDLDPREVTAAASLLMEYSGAAVVR